MYEASLRFNTTLSYLPTPFAPRILPQTDMGIVDSGTTHLYITPSATNGSPNTSASKIVVGTANGQVESSSAKDKLPILQLESDFPTIGYTMTSFTNMLVGVGPICDTDCTVVFTKQDITVFLPGVNAILTGWR